MFTILRDGATIGLNLMVLIERIISGGQTGADRAALDFAIAHGITHGGWCPAGRLAEDGPIEQRYQLKETPRADYLQRTERNVRDADGTVIFTLGRELSGGSKRTAQFASQQGKPCLHLSAQAGIQAAQQELQAFIRQHGIKVLNVAGTRASKEPDVGAFVAETLRLALLDDGPRPRPMTEHPVIKTARLILRPWKADDASPLQRLAGRREIADTMVSVPHPFTQQYAEKWIAGHAEAYARGEALHFAITLADTGALAGAVELRAINAEHWHAELSCWIGVEWWGQGLATEAAFAVVRHGFERLNLNRIVAFHMVRNPASGRALGKIGMKREGLLRQCVRKWNKFEDVVLMAVLREDWTGDAKPAKPEGANEAA